MATYEKEAIGPGKMQALISFGKRNQHSAYASIL